MPSMPIACWRLADAPLSTRELNDWFELRWTPETGQESGSTSLSRNIVRRIWRILRRPDRTVDQAGPCDEATLASLKVAFERARGNVVRVQELLGDDGLDVRCSTLTTIVGSPTAFDPLPEFSETHYLAWYKDIETAGGERPTQRA
jgi:hypothetical protein